MNDKEIVRSVVQLILREELEDIIESSRAEIEDEVRTQLAPLLRRRVRECIEEELGRMTVDADRVISEGPRTSEEGIGTDLSLHETEKVEVPSAQNVEAMSSGDDHVLEGLYLFCLTQGEGALPDGTIGLDGEGVFLLTEDGITAIVQSCRLEPYESSDMEQVKVWVQAHQAAVDSAQVAFGTILPFGFDTIIKPEDGRSADQVLRKWLREEHSGLSSRMDRIEGKNEFGIQVFYEPAKVLENVIRDSQKIRELREEMGAKSPGAAYLFKQKIETSVHREMEQVVEASLQDFLERIKATVDDLRLEKNKKGDPDQAMLLNLSVLVGDDKELKELLSEIDAREEYSVRFTGPWPPYSFVS